MKIGTLRARLAVLTLAMAAAFPHASFAQNEGGLTEIVVTASRYEQPFADVVSDFTLIDQDEISRRGTTSIQQILALQPGIQVSGNSVYLRGAETRMTALYLDGVRVDTQDGQSLGGGVPWDLISVEQIDRIEILRGAASAMYGADAMGGVIQIFTRRGVDGMQPFASFGVGNNSTQKVATGVRGASESMDYALSLAREDNGGINTRPDLKHTPDKEGYNKNFAQIKWGYNFNTMHRIEAHLAENRMEYRTVPWGGGTDLTANGVLRTRLLGFKSKWTDTLRSSFKITQSVSAKKDDAPNDYATTLDGVVLDTEIKAFGGIVTGLLEQKRDAFDAQPTQWDPSVNGSRTDNAYGLGYGSKRGAHTYQINFRQDADSIFGQHQTGAVSYAYALTTAWRTSVSAGNAFRAPTLEQTFGPYGSVTLQPEKSKNSEISLDYTESNIIWKATFYRNNFENLISSSPTLASCSAGMFCWYNIGKASVEGFSTRASYQWQNFQLFGLADWLNPKNEITGQNLLNRAQRTVTVGFESQSYDWKYGFDIKDTGERFDNSDGMVILPSYTLLNIYVDKKLSKQWQWKARLDNATDVKYQNINKVATPGATFFTSLHWTP